MLGLIMLIASVIIMVRVAEAEDRSTLLWGAITLVLCVVGDSVLPAFFGIFAGLCASFGAMFVLNVVQD